MAAVIFHSSYTEKHGPPSMTDAMGAGTMNGTWAAGIFHVSYWKLDKIRYMVALKPGTNMGMDFAVSQDDFAFYIVFGTAWLR